jgi:hypothetical protein
VAYGDAVQVKSKDISCSAGWWLVLICWERKILLADWWLMAGVEMI